MTATTDLSELLRPTHYIDSDSPEVRGFVAEVLGDTRAGATDKAIRLFDAVRDRFRYDPFHISFEAEEYRASAIAKKPAHFCIPKGIFLTAALRAAGIPAAAGFADVRNHLNTPKLADLMGSDLFIYHGYVALWLDGRMFKVTPAFNTELCQRFGVRELIFDGHSDALFHEFDAADRRHMEYVNDRGWFVEPPVVQLLEEFRRFYPKMYQASREKAEVHDPLFGPAA